MTLNSLYCIACYLRHISFEPFYGVLLRIMDSYNALNFCSKLDTEQCLTEKVKTCDAAYQKVSTLTEVTRIWEGPKGNMSFLFEAWLHILTKTFLTARVRREDKEAAGAINARLQGAPFKNFLRITGK